MIRNLEIYILVHMKPISITLLFILWPLLTFSQSRSSFDFLFGVDRSYRFNQDLDQLTFPGRPANQGIYGRSSHEESIKGWHLGINYNQILFDDIKIKLGLRVMRGGFSSGQINDFETQEQQDGLDGWIVEPPLTDRWERTYNYYFLELPVGLRYEYNITGRFQPYVEAGMGPAFLIGSQVRDVTNIQINKSKQDDLQLVQFVGFLSPGFNCKMNEQSFIFFQPIMRLHATTIQKDSIFEDYLYSVGIEIGLRKNLR